jgi:hypothetical protein
VPEKEPFDGQRALRAMADAQRRGLEAAASVVERMLELGRQGARSPFPLYLPREPAAGEDRGGEDGGAAEDPGREARRLRADAERLFELVGESMRVVLDVAVDAAESGTAGSNGDGAAGELSLGPAGAGEEATASAWLHVLDGPPASPARLHATTLTAHDGATIESGAASFEPPLLESFDLRSSEEIEVTVAVPGDAQPGTYRGHVLAAGLPEVALPLVLEVRG